MVKWRNEMKPFYVDKSFLHEDGGESLWAVAPEKVFLASDLAQEIMGRIEMFKNYKEYEGKHPKEVYIGAWQALEDLLTMIEGKENG